MKKSKYEAKMLKREYNKRVSEMNRVRSELQCAYSVFNSTTDPDIMDACIFEISALKSRYNYAVNSVRQLDISQN